MDNTRIVSIAERDRQQLVSVISELLKDDQAVRTAILKLVMACPNIVTKY